MKPFLRLLPLVAVLLAAISLCAQDSSAASAAAERRLIEERLKELSVLSSDVGQILAKQVRLEQRIASLEEELRVARVDNARDAARYASRDDLKRIDTELLRLAKTLQEVDQKREADKKLLLATLDELRVAIEELRKVIKAAVAAPPSPPRPSPVTTETAPPRSNQKGFVHKVDKGQNLSTIIEAYNVKLKEEGSSKRITLPAVLAANPGLVPERMQIGQEIFLPDPRE
jgi:hypothetical protein